jgi:hypothetical protein
MVDRRRGRLSSVLRNAVHTLVLVALVVVTVEFVLLLLASNTVEAAAQAGLVAAGQEGATREVVESAVRDTLAGEPWVGSVETGLFIDGVRDVGQRNYTSLEKARDGARVKVVVTVPAPEAGPDWFAALGLSIRNLYLHAEAEGLKGR